MAYSVEQPDWTDQIRDKLISLFQNNPATLTRILFFLDEEDKAYRSSGSISPIWKTLRSTLSSTEAFRLYAERIAEDTMKPKMDENYRSAMRTIHDNLLEHSEKPFDENRHQGLDLVRLENMEVIGKGSLMGLSKSWSKIPKTTQLVILKYIPSVVAKKAALTAVDEAVGLVSKSGGNQVMIGLAVAHLSYEVITNIRRWWKGEISGTRCAKNILDSTLTIGAGMAGGAGGAAVGGLAGPIGAFVGGVAGGLVGSLGASVLSDWMTQKLFGVPKDEALENAYKYFGVTMRATNYDINSKYRALSLTHHPDRGGKPEDFHILQLNLAVIKAARGELY